jgi:lipoprotein-anchoring transpeptidase ErfK/SrfK
MRRCILFAGLLGLVLAFPAMAQAQIVAKINLSTQRMDVYVDGSPRYRWPVSTARAGYHRSTIYSGSPMPYSIFFLRGYAIHGSYETKYLGRPASHGCIRLHPSNAAALYALVQQHGTGNTVIKISY